MDLRRETPACLSQCLATTFDLLSLLLFFDAKLQQNALSKPLFFLITFKSALKIATEEYLKISYPLSKAEA